MSTQAPTKTSITNVRVFNGETFTDPTTITINNGLIDNPDSSSGKVLDAQGAFLIPGLIDSHIHLSGPEDLSTMASYGVTTALDMATWSSELLNSCRNQKGVTDIRSCGLAATAPGSLHSHIPGIRQEALISNAAEGEHFVLRMIEEGADYIKMVADIPGPSQESLNAISDTAHRHGKLVIAHAVTTAATEMAQRAGADIITHIPVDGLMTQKAIEEMVRAKRISVPTLTMMKGACSRRGAEFSVCKENVGALYRAGVPVLAGTDANRVPGVPMNVLHGVSLHEELELLVECGLSPAQVLRATTSEAARVFGLRDRGEIEVGYRADLVLVARNPLEGISATKEILKAWVGGEEYVPAQDC